MTSFYLHFVWFFILMIIFVCSLFLLILIYFSNQSLFFYFSLFSGDLLNLNVSFSIDYFSSIFFSVVVLISTVIMIYSYSYLSPYSKATVFLWLTFLFVFSMLIVILMTNIFYLMLGWDGLGLISFFLIVYYQNQSSITSGILTLLMNRIGDCFFLITISLFFFYSLSLSFTCVSVSSLLVFFVCLTFMTKSAIYPFSSWLPMAMAAPTPISALVHSSTLVTSGLFLMIRFSYLIYSNSFFVSLMLCLSVFTSFYAGMNSLVEVDLKKLIALSTLSHLGFISMAFFSGLIHLSFFHLLVHALFKSLLFMCMGDIMINLSHSQDIRYLSDGMNYTPFSSLMMMVSLLNLLGLPNMSGFFSKDLILESLNYSFSSFLILIMVYFSLFFTYFYTFKLFFYSFQSNKISSFSLFHSVSVFHSFLLLFLGVFSIFFGYFFLNYFIQDILFLSLFMAKFYPFFLCCFLFILLVSFSKIPFFKDLLFNCYFSQMMFLTNIVMSFMSNLYYHVSYSCFSSLESGLGNSVLNNSFYSLFSSLNKFTIFHLSSFSIMNSLVVFFMFLIPFFYFL